jgi:VanZ family protein
VIRRVLGHALTWYAIGALLILVVVVASLVPARDLPHIGMSDKSEHMIAYFGLFLWFGGLLEPRRYAWLTFGLLLLGGGMEIAQGMMRLGREADLHDFLADGIGVGAGLILCFAGLRHWVSWIEHWTRRR